MTAQQQTWQNAPPDVWSLFRETSAQFKEIAARFKATDEQFKQTDKKINDLSALFSDQWGKMVEALVEPSALQLFQDRGIEVHYTYRRVEAQLNGRQIELDLLLENGDEIVVVEVKSNLRVGDVNDFIETLNRFPEFFPRYREYKIYGGVAGLMFSEESDKYAYRKGLFVLSATGDGIAQIQNDMAFLPKNFAHN